MPKQKAPKGAASAAPSTSINDPRFSNFATDPRYRLPSKKNTKTKVDKRFSRMFTDDAFSNTAKVDRYGRKVDVGKKKKKALERLYVAEDEDKEEDSDEEGESSVKSKEKVADADSNSENEEEFEVEDDEVVEAALKRAYDPARHGGFSSSEDEDENEEDGGVEIEEVEFPDIQAESAAVEMGEVTTRFAVVNLDWDNIKSTDLMAVFSSFVPAGGKIIKVSVYPSEFGKERMQREELEGPPKEIFARKEESEEEEVDSEDSEDEDAIEEEIKKDLQKGDNSEEFDGTALRQYQLERLKYFYAVVICSDKDTAQKIYEATDGSEYLSSANFFDLRFIPDGTEFEEKPRDECDSVPAGYKPIEFVTDALQHSKVKLTWDTAPEEASRKDAINRAFSGSRTEINENDLRAYLGSDSESDDADEAFTEAAEAEGIPEAAPAKLSKKELARKKMREALGLTDEPAPKASKISSGPVGDMEITFTAGLSTSDKKGSIFQNEPIKEETTAERYIRLEKERKARRKEKSKAKREGRDPDAPDADEKDKEREEEDLGFNDPFFATNPAEKEKAAKSHSKSQRKEDRLAKRAAKAEEAATKASQRAELELLMQDNSTEIGANVEHFDINEIARAEKRAKKKGRKGEKGAEVEVEGGKRGGLQKGFEMDVGDERFKKIFESHEFAIDPSNPKFKGTEGMKKLLEAGRKKRAVEEDGDEVVEKKSKKRKPEGGEGKSELSGLVEAVKKKSKS